MEAGRVVGDITELDYPIHVKEMLKYAVPISTVSLKYEDGAELHMTYERFDKTSQRLAHEHGNLTYMRREPEDEDKLSETLQTARVWRNKESRPAKFKVRVQTQKKPSIKDQIGVAKQQLSQERAAAPQKAAAKSHELEV